MFVAAAFIRVPVGPGPPVFLIRSMTGPPGILIRRAQCGLRQDVGEMSVDEKIPPRKGLVSLEKHAGKLLLNTAFKLFTQPKLIRVRWMD